jgi:tRNA-specific 2-thiouridylase
VAVGEPRFVSRADPAAGLIQLARRADLETREVPVEGMSFVADAPPGGRAAPFRAAVRIRHRGPVVPATVRPATDDEPVRGGRWVVETEEPVWAVAPDQAAVLYDGETCLGGGRIASARRAADAATVPESTAALP